MTDNGGPPIDVEPPKLRWAKINVAEVLEGIDALSWEERGYYLTALFKMYARMGGIPADERLGSQIMRCDVRTFRRLRDKLIGFAKFYIEDGMLKNSRVEREIAEYIREFKKRSEAALEREKKAREAREAQAELQARTGELQPDFAETLAQSRPEVGEKSGELEVENQAKSTDAPPQVYQKATTNQNQNQNHKEERSNIRAAEAAHLDTVFEEFWIAFPPDRRRGKGKCRDLFRQIASGKNAKRKATADEMLAAVRAGYGIDPNFPPMPETWLNQGRWEDAPKTAQAIAEPEPDPVNGKSWGWWRPRRESLLRLSSDRWENAIADHPPNGTWPWWIFGPPPGHPECLMPAELVAKYGFAEIYRGKIKHD